MKHPLYNRFGNFMKAAALFIMLAVMPNMLFSQDTVTSNTAGGFVMDIPVQDRNDIAGAILERPLAIGNALIVWPDRDMDGLDDEMEARLAETTKPLLVFDSGENACEKGEPLTLFQVRPLNLSKPDGMSARIRWVLLFRKNGGYGPCSTLCGGGHKGDIKVLTYDMASNDGGKTWETASISLGKKETLRWHKGSGKIGSYSSHPVIFVSSGNHDLYFIASGNGISSPYSLFGCCDSADGKGAAILPEIKNVGEPESHPGPVFTDSLMPDFPGCSAWRKDSFLSIWAGTISDTWLNNKIIPRDASLCSIESLSLPGSFIRHKRYLGEVSNIVSARDRLDSRFRMVPDPAGEAAVMLESVNYPGYFLADRNGRLVLVKPGNEEEKKSSLFKMRKGLKGRNTVSFESVSKSDFYICQRDGHLYVESGRGKTFRKGASFRVRPPV